MEGNSNGRKAVKRTRKGGEEQMEVVSGIEGKSQSDVSSVKRIKSIHKGEYRKVAVPAHRFGPLKQNWIKIFTPLVEQLHLQVRFNIKTRNVEIRTCEATKDLTLVQKAADFVKAFVLGFEVEDALALLRLDELFIDSFDIQDVKPLKGEHVSRAIGRMAGRGGRTKFTIENVTKTRIVVADSRIHILGTFQNIQIARRAISNLIMGSPPSKVYGQLRAVANKTSQRI